MKHLKASIFEVRVDNFWSFEGILKELSTKLDDVNQKNIRILYENQNNKKTSIWFDSFDYEADFNSDGILKNATCFLLAKDMDYSMVEDTEKNQLSNISKNAKTQPKIPSHCVYLPKDKILIIEESANSANIATIKKGIYKHCFFSKEHLDFKVKNREDVIERLRKFLENIESIDLIDLNLTKYLPKDENGELLSIITNSNAKIKATLSIKEKEQNFKEKILNFFVNILENKIDKEMKNIKIKYTNENEQREIAELYSNLISLKLEKEHYHTDIGEFENNEHGRIVYSKGIYKSLIEAYNAQNIL